MFTIRLAKQADFPAIQRVETGAAERFLDVGLSEIARGPALPVARLRQFYEYRGLFVLSHDEKIIGMAACEALDGAGYLAELDVLPLYAGQRLARVCMKKTL